ncbi:sentrin-specific protease 8-like [Teleopsis dalmanni]|uniref:sentrin-specific protease 8-like n=1 Tax=Teleopsis dalmanni TaxID=139649 RepID=UPI0018CF1AD8|nr:sentrin-specific protease 8-like [Teleopsis dalmanni]XP_037954523.1 sentrin-specific protease 8-like [Teleopsis dalmanni]
MSLPRRTKQSDPVCLNFHESCLRMSDVQLLQGPHWLNDQIISFYFEYLERVKYKNNSEMLFVSPEVTQCMKLVSEDELTTLLNQLDAASKMFILFALNDNTTTLAGGTHWSLFALSRPEKTFFHFDSHSNQNSEAAHQFMQQVKDALHCKKFNLKSVKCLQQANSYDCGIHVLCMADNIADHVNRFECIEDVALLHQDAVKGKRSELLKLIHTLGGKLG